MVITTNHPTTSNITTKASSPKKFRRSKTKVANYQAIPSIQSCKQKICLMPERKVVILGQKGNNLLNKRPEIVWKCQHKFKYILKLFDIIRSQCIEKILFVCIFNVFLA